jgi:xylulose-5-phosphate/fructose-6-phosphate phosphoketolase
MPTDPTPRSAANESLSAYGAARSTVQGRPLGAEELASVDAFWRASNYLALGMIYLRENPLLRSPLQADHIKNRLLGHWGSSPALSFIYTHVNRLLRHDERFEAVFLAGPGHGAPGVLGPVYLEGTYSKVYPDKSLDEVGLERLFRSFSSPGGIGSHCTPELPGSIHEGGELGYVLSHACGVAFDNPSLTVVAVVGDGEAETGPLATSWHINKFLHPARDGAVLPVLNLNGYKINNPTLLARISRSEIEALFQGYGWTPYFVEGSDPESMHQAMAATLDACADRIREAKAAARAGRVVRPRWPMIVLRSPKGWTAPTEIDGKRVEGFWRAHQVPVADVKTNDGHRTLLEAWLRSYRPEELFDDAGAPRAHVRAAAPPPRRCMGASPHANGGLVKRALSLPDFSSYAVPVEKPGVLRAENTRPFGGYLRDTMKQNPETFRVFGPDENTSNKLDAVYQVAKKLWMAELFPEDEGGSELSQDGRVVEMLSEHTVEGMLEGYLLSGRHGVLSSYEAFVHVIDSMFNQHAKWLAMSRDLSWRAKIASLNLLITSTVWRQDHNGFTHQDPGFLDVVVNKSPLVTRVYLPPDANCLLSVAAHCLQSEDYVNVIVSDKQNHLQYLPIDEAIVHCTKGIGIWPWASTDRGAEPDVVIASAGDIATLEALAATALLRAELPDLKIRFVNVVDLFRLQPESEHPHGFSDRDFDALFTTDKPVIFNFHGYPWLIHRLAYRRTNHENMHVRGYKEKGSINTPLELAIANDTDRFGLAIDVIDRVPRLRAIGSHTKEKLRNERIGCRMHAHEHGIDRPDIVDWSWPFG